MSLFKARDFWSFNLSDLPTISRTDDDEQQEEGDEGAFVADLGRFQAINEARHDVLVCAHLRGLIFILQVPESEQMKFHKNGEDATKIESQRQLLLAKKLDGEDDNNQESVVVVDLKCGYFSSTTKQSIAVLTSRPSARLIVFQVKQQAVDLISGDRTVPEFSHCLEEQYRIDLLQENAGEMGFAQCLVVLGRRHNCCDTQSSSSSSAEGDKLSLPQRDSIVVQYTNQLVFSLIDHKKVVGHYKLQASGLGDLDESMLRLAQCTGCMPAAHLNGERQSLVISLSDRRLCSLPLAKLTSQAKENVVKRVARNLLGSSTSQVGHETIELELDSISEWQRDLISAPLQLIGVARDNNCGQLLVMSRYNLDLYSSSRGEHLWSQRFETSLICAQIYTNPSNEKQKASGNDLFVLVCSDCLSGDKCNLSIMREDQIVWSALLNSKPAQLWRAQLQKMPPGLLVSLDAQQGQVNVSYLGTNNSSEVDDDTTGESQLDVGGSTALTELETLDDCFSDNKQTDRQQAEALSVQVHLEASNQWPNVCVKCKLSLSARSASVGLLQNIVLLMDFDESLQFELITARVQQTQPSDSSIQLHLGNCWPDRREPLAIEGTFRLRPRDPSSSVAPIDDDCCRLMQTQSLRVNLLFRFNEIHSKVALQEESFLLPLSLIGQLTLIDYSSTPSVDGGDTETTLANLQDVLANLGPTYSFERMKFSDIFLRSRMELLELVDELIEADLVCRGLEPRRREEQQQRRLSTLENLNLLAQSLDCRLRFKSLARPSSTTPPQLQQVDSSESAVASGQQNIVMISIGLKMLPLDCSALEAHVWLHLLDLQSLADDASSAEPLVEQFVRQHLAQWKWHKSPLRADNSEQVTANPILISIESDSSQAVLVLQNHLIERTLIMSNQPCGHLHESQHDSLEINLSNLTRMNSFVASSRSMHEHLVKLANWHELEVTTKWDSTRLELALEMQKFEMSTCASLAMAKKLANLPDEMQEQFQLLGKVINRIQLNMTRLLTEMERLKQLERTFSSRFTPATISGWLHDDC